MLRLFLIGMQMKELRFASVGQGFEHGGAILCKLSNGNFLHLIVC